MIHLGVPSLLHMHSLGCQSIQGRVVGHIVSVCIVIFYGVLWNLRAKAEFLISCPALPREFYEMNGMGQD